MSARSLLDVDLQTLQLAERLVTRSAVVDPSEWAWLEQELGDLYDLELWHVWHVTSLEPCGHTWSRDRLVDELVVLVLADDPAAVPLEGPIVGPRVTSVSHEGVACHA